MNKVLIAYFSASGVTAKAAQKLAKVTEADLFEIVPELPYTKADLNWMNKNSRSSVEMKDRNCRPAIAVKTENMAQYDTVFVGFPIWWYREPSIIDTFIESYDFSGKTIVLFCTSGSSGFGTAKDNIQALAKDAVVIEGKRFSLTTTENSLKKWINEISI